MTIKENIQLPVYDDALNNENPKEIGKYLRDLTLSIQRMYEDLAQGVNGNIQTDSSERTEQWIPDLQGTNPGTFIYDHKIGWSYRQGIFVDCWFDVKWSSTGASGNLYLKLPYKAAISSQKPFVGVLQPSGLTYTAGTDIVINAIPGSFTGEFWNIGDGFTSANQSVTATGQLAGHIRYIGVADD